MPRITLITGKTGLPAEQHALADSVMKVFGNPQVRGPYSVLLHSPKLAAHLLPLVTHFRDENSVEPKLRSIAIITAVREREAPYVWAAQVGAARRNGVSEATIDVIRAKGDPGKLPADERDVVNYVRQTMRTNRVDQATFDALRKNHDEKWLVDLTAAANYYAFVSAMVLPFDVPAPPEGDKLPS